MFIQETFIYCYPLRIILKEPSKIKWQIHPLGVWVNHGSRIWGERIKIPPGWKLGPGSGFHGEMVNSGHRPPALTWGWSVTNSDITNINKQGMCFQYSLENMNLQVPLDVKQIQCLVEFLKDYRGWLYYHRGQKHGLFLIGPAVTLVSIWWEPPDQWSQSLSLVTKQLNIIWWQTDQDQRSTIQI